jgi:hypothetical protein
MTVVAIAAAISFRPQAVPAAPPPVRLEGDFLESDPSPGDLVVVPFPPVELGEPGDGTPVTTTTSLADEAPDGDETPGPTDTLDETPDTSSDTDDASADTPDDD